VGDVVGGDDRARREPRLQQAQHRKTALFPAVEQRQADRARYLSEGMPGVTRQDRRGRADASLRQVGPSGITLPRA